METLIAILLLIFLSVAWSTILIPRVIISAKASAEIRILQAKTEREGAIQRQLQEMDKHQLHLQRETQKLEIERLDAEARRALPPDAHRLIEARDLAIQQAARAYSDLERYKSIRHYR